MKKKLRKLLKKSLPQTKSAFSLVEITVSLVVIAVIIAALTPIISKRLTASSSIKNKISTDCDPYYPDGFCAMCYITPKSCVTCTRNCAFDEYKNVSSCVCEKCSIRYNDSNCAGCNSKKCTQCKDGYYLNSVGKCIICPLGHYCYRNDESSVKFPCAKGTVAPREGMSACEKCKRSSASQVGSVAISEGMSSCTNCPAGKYAETEGQGNACTTCPKGYYCPQGKYIPCPRGYANNSLGAVKCNACVRSSETVGGTFSSTEGAQYCQSAYAHGKNFATYVEKDADIKENNCPRGYYCPQGKIIPCPRGTANNSVGEYSCNNCDKSTSVIAGSVAVNTGMTSCSVCGAGTYAKINKQTTPCEACPVGMQCSGGKIAQCPAGYYSKGGASSCTICPSGTTSNAGASSCLACAAGCTKCSSANTSVCSSCKAGYYLDSGIRGPARDTCFICEKGYYCSGGTADRVSCGSAKTSNAGASKASDCKKCSDFSAQCVACSMSGCTKCAEGYKVDGTGCKVSFDCEAEGGRKAGNLCYKEVYHKFYTPKNGNADVVDAGLICGSGWRLPSHIDLCTVKLNSTINKPMSRHNPLYNYVGGTEASKCTTYVAPDLCRLYDKSSSTTSYKYSPVPGCKIHPYGGSRPNSSSYYYTNVGCVRNIE